MNSRFVLALGVSAGLALLVSLIFYQVAVRGRPAEVEEVEMVEIVTATKDLSIGATITPADLRMEAWPKNKLPDGAFTEMDQVLERVAISSILNNEPILNRRLAQSGAGVGLSPMVPEGMRAMSVRVDDVIGVAGFVFPEARVDVLLTGNPRDQPEAGRMTRTILTNVRVISAGENLTPDASGRPQRVPVVTLLVTPEQAEVLTLGSTGGRLQLVLRNTRDNGDPDTPGIVERELFSSGRPPKPAPRPVSRPAPAPVVMIAPPPPSEIDVFRGNRKSVESFDAMRD